MSARPSRPGGGAPRRVVVVGHGMAAGRLVEELLADEAAAGLEITVLGDERHGAYNRVLLSSVLAGHHDPGDVLLRAAQWYERRGVRVHSATRAVAVDRDARAVTTLDGRVFPYDTLVLATGSAPLLPPIRGLVRDGGELLPGVFAFRTLDDCAAMLEAAARCRRAVVVGGGLLGLEAARGLHARGVAVEIVHAGPWLMNAQLDEGGATVLRRVAAGLGLASYLQARVTQAHGDSWVTGLRLGDGFELACDLVVLACGVVPNTRLAAEAGLTVGRGVVVDDAMRSVDDPSVFAIGDCAEHRGRVYGLVAPAWEQAAVAARAILDAEPAEPYAGSRLITRLKALGIDLAAMGDTLDDPHADHDGAAEVVQFVDPVRGTYKKLVIRDGRLAGAVLLGDIGTVAAVSLAFDRQTVLPPDRMHLLFDGLGVTRSPADPAALPDDATVCHCNAVPAGRVRAAARDGAGTVEQVAGRTRATTGCGTCRDTVRALIDTERKVAA